ncbi:MAG: pilin [Patescibacteria group bacterium]|jgi:hypothetical protein|nr:pilin [Patescibacteria group bacterium]
MKKNKKIFIYSSIILLFSFFSSININTTNAAGCGWACLQGSNECSDEWGEGAYFGKTFSTDENNPVDCSFDNQPKCAAHEQPVCCCTPENDIRTPGNSYSQQASGNEIIQPKFEIPELQIDLPINFGNVECENNNQGGFDCTVSWIGDYVSYIYRYGLSVAGILAAIMLMVGGVIWLTSGGDSGKITKAKSFITNSIIGILILFSAYIILEQINPELTKLDPITIGQKGTTGGVDGDFDDVISANKSDIEVDKVYAWDDEGTKDSIKNQVGDASPELAAFINCMSKNLPSGVGRISSISDSNFIGTLTLCETSCSNCVHTCGSCHYGGGTGDNKSYAIDYGDEKNKTELIKAANKCGVYADGPGFILDEDDHIHMSVPDCPGK